MVSRNHKRLCITCSHDDAHDDIGVAVPPARQRSHRVVQQRLDVHLWRRKLIYTCLCWFPGTHRQVQLLCLGIEAGKGIAQLCHRVAPQRALVIELLGVAHHFACAAHLLASFAGHSLLI